MMLDIGQVACFLHIVELGSFTKAAERLGIAQSAVSQKLHRLEDQLGIRLLDRTSRTLALTNHGIEFLPYARQVLEAEGRARSAAHRIVQRSRNTVRLGSFAFLVDMRGELIQGFLAHAPGTQIDVEFGSRRKLLEMLREGTADACLCIAGPEGVVAEFSCYRIRHLVAYVSLPPNHPLAGRNLLRRDDFRDLELVISPGKDDTATLETLARGLTAMGALLIRAPEAERRLIAIFAQSRGLPWLRWLPKGTPSHRIGVEAVVPIEGDPFFMDHLIYLSPHRSNSAVEKFHSYVRESAEPMGRLQPEPVASRIA